MPATVDKPDHAGHRFAETAGIVTFMVLELLVAWRAIDHAHNLLTWLVIAGATLLGFVIADFMSGVIHWAFDRYGTVDTLVFGPNFIAPFREHHLDPKGITKHDFIETNGNNCISTVPFLIAAASINPAWGNFALLVACSLAAMCLFVFGTNQFHKWAHDDNPPAYAVLLQQWHLILDKPGHDIHHTPPYTRYYCITTGWLNPVLNKLRFFERAEDLILRVTGVQGGVDHAKSLQNKP